MPAKTHGHSRDGGMGQKCYRAWVRMRERCSNPNDAFYHCYGGRGISVCDRWQTYENFLADMGLPEPGLSIDRHPNGDGNYEPGNCRWATTQEQSESIRRRGRKPVLSLLVLDKVRALASQGLSTRKIAEKVGIGKSQVWRIVNGDYDEKGPSPGVSQ